MAFENPVGNQYGSKVLISNCDGRDQKDSIFQTVPKKFREAFAYSMANNREPYPACIRYNRISKYRFIKTLSTYIVKLYAPGSFSIRVHSIINWKWRETLVPAN